jgi:hypothetical protein
MDVVQYTVDAYGFLLTLIGVILRAMVEPLGVAVAALVLLLIGGSLYLILVRRSSRRPR